MGDALLFVGRLHKLKSLDVLIKASSIVVQRYGRDVRFLVIGPGDLVPYIVLAARLQVEAGFLFLGFVDEDMKIGALDALVCLMLPNISDYAEVYYMVISEAWTRRKPVVISSVGGIPYRVKYVENQVLVSLRDPERLVGALLMLLEGKELVKRLGGRASTRWRLGVALAEEFTKALRGSAKAEAKRECLSSPL